MTTGISYRRREHTNWIIVHASHTEPGTIARPIEWLKVYGRINGLLGIGYHYVIFEDGELVACRPISDQGSHCRGFNEDSVGVLLMGGLRHRPGPDGELIPHHCDTFTPAQKQKLKALTEYVWERYPEAKLRGHTEMGHHAKRHPHPCPPMNMEKFRQCFLPSSQSS